MNLVKKIDGEFYFDGNTNTWPIEKATAFVTAVLSPWRSIQISNDIILLVLQVLTSSLVDEWNLVGQLRRRLAEFRKSFENTRLLAGQYTIGWRNDGYGLFLTLQATCGRSVTFSRGPSALYISVNLKSGSASTATTILEALIAAGLDFRGDLMMQDVVVTVDMTIHDPDGPDWSLYSALEAVKGLPDSQNR